MNNMKKEGKSYNFWEFLTDFRFIIAVIVVLFALLYELGILKPS